MATGRGFGRLCKGERITSLADVRLGDVLLMHSRRFDAENTIRVISLYPDRFYWRYVYAEDVNTFHAADGNLQGCVWAWEFEVSADLFWHALQPAKPPTSLPLFEASHV